jgi:hypothetical protein
MKDTVKCGGNLHLHLQIDRDHPRHQGKKPINSQLTMPIDPPQLVYMLLKKLGWADTMTS